MNGGMGTGFSGPDLAAAVMHERLIGVIAGSACGYVAHQDETLKEGDMDARIQRYYAGNVDELIRQAREAREREPYGVLGVNIMAAMSDFRPMVEAAGRSGLYDFLFVGAGLPRQLAQQMKEFDARMGYVVITSTPRAFDTMLKSAEKYECMPAAIYNEDPRTAGGHLGAGAADLATAFGTKPNPNAKPGDPPPDPSRYDTRKLAEQFHEMAPSIPLIRAGGVVYGADIDQGLDEGYEVFSWGSRLLHTVPSGLPKHIMRDDYLGGDAPVVQKMTSPAGLPSCYIEKEEKPLLTEARLEQIKSNCVSCIGNTRCKCYNTTAAKEAAKDPSERTYCIAEQLTKTQRGEEGGVLFTGARLPEMRTDELYRRDGQLYIPTVREALDFMFNGMRKEA